MARTSEPTDPLLGKVLGSYRVAGVVGQGGMGRVYVVEHTLLGKRAALKMLRRELSAQEDLVERFFNEARAAAHIRHPGIVDVYDFGWADDGAAYLVMELLDGQSLASRVANGPLPEAHAVEILRQAASALGAAHAAGIVHRDLKPDNIYLVADPTQPERPRVKVLDFGIAKLGQLPSEAALGGGRRQTRNGTLMGTPAYMAPEQWRGAGAVDSRADLYSLGCVAYELLSGQPPFLEEGVLELLVQHQSARPAPLTRVSPPLAALVEQLLAKKPEARPRDMAEVVARLGGDAATARAVTALGGDVSPFAQTVTPLPAGAPRRTPSRGGTLQAAASEVITSPRGRGGSTRVAVGVFVGLALGVTLFAGLTTRRASDAQALAPAPAHPHIRLSIDSVPAGADVYRAVDGVLLGKTPHVTVLEASSGTAAYLVRRAGYLDEHLTFAASRDAAATLTLRPAPAPAAVPVVATRPTRAHHKPAPAAVAVRPAQPARTDELQSPNGVLDPFGAPFVPARTP